MNLFAMKLHHRDDKHVCEIQNTEAHLEMMMKSSSLYSGQKLSCMSSIVTLLFRYCKNLIYRECIALFLAPFNVCATEIASFLATTTWVCQISWWPVPVLTVRVALTVLKYSPRCMPTIFLR